MVIFHSYVKLPEGSSRLLDFEIVPDFCLALGQPQRQYMRFVGFLVKLRYGSKFDSSENGW